MAHKLVPPTSATKVVAIEMNSRRDLMGSTIDTILLYLYRCAEDPTRNPRKAKYVSQFPLTGHVSPFAQPRYQGIENEES